MKHIENLGNEEIEKVILFLVKIFVLIQQSSLNTFIDIYIKTSCMECLVQVKKWSVF